MLRGIEEATDEMRPVVMVVMSRALLMI